MVADYLWLHMAGLFGHRWTSSFGDDPRSIGGREWAQTLQGFTRAQLDVGLASCRATGDDWPPSAPGFRAMCLGIPTFAAVKAELLSRNTKRSRFVLLVWSYVDAYAVRTSDQQRSDRLLMAAYELAREKVMRGEPMPELPVGAIAQDESAKPKPAPPEVAAERLAECRSLLGDAKPRPKVDEVPTAGRTSSPADIEAQLQAHYASIGKPAPTMGHAP